VSIPTLPHQARAARSTTAYAPASAGASRAPLAQPASDGGRHAARTARWL